MGVFSRLSDIINSNINSMLDKAEDPEKIARLIIQEMEDCLVEVRSAAARSMADKKEYERDIVQLEQTRLDWTAKAELAVEKGREDLARGALSAKQRAEREIDSRRQALKAIDEVSVRRQDDLEKLLRTQFPDLASKYVRQFALLFLDLQKKCDSAEISTKALDLRGMLDALRLIRRGIPAGAALDMGITNKAFDSYEQSLIRDVIAARIPAKLDAAKLFG